MKYLLFLLLLASCDHKPTVKGKPTTYTLGSNMGAEYRLEVVIIDGCQYLYGPWGNATVLTHKGNCNNPIHPEHTRQ